MSILDIFGDGSCIALYELDGNANDTGGNYNGTWIGTEQYETGKIGQCAKFDGSSLIKIPTPQMNLPVSYSAWIKTTQSSHGYYWWTNPTIVGCAYDGKSGDFIFQITNGHLSCVYDRGDINNHVSTAFVADGVWHHVACVLTHGQAKMYVDGNLVFTTSFSNPGDYVHSGLQIGGLANNYGDYVFPGTSFIGLIDHVRIFNKELSDEEVRILYAEGAAKFLVAKTDGTVWTYDGVSWVQVASDKSSLTEDIFKNQGIGVPFTINKSKLQELGTELEILVFAGSSISIPSVTIRNVPKDSLVVQKSLIPLIDYEQVNSITINTSGTGVVKVLVSRDLQKWYKIDSGSWTLVKDGVLNPNDVNDINLVLTQGNDVSEVNSLTLTDIQNFFGGAAPDNIAFAFAFSYQNENDNATVNDIVLNVKPKSMWQVDTHNHTIIQGIRTVKVIFSSDGNFKVNILS